MSRSALYLILLFVFISACEEVYRTELDAAENLLVINAKISNNPQYNNVRVTKTKGFWSNDRTESVDNAEIWIVGEEHSYKLFNTGEGNYINIYELEPNKSYKLKIELDQNTYESDWETMPALPEIIKFYAQHEVKTTYSKNIYGDLLSTTKEGFNISVDLPVSQNSRYYRFTWKSVLPLMLSPPAGSMATPYFVWITLYPNNEYNLASLPEFSNSKQINMHSLIFMENDYQKYYDPEREGIYEPYSVYPNGWIFEVDQFSINENAYTFYSQIEDQLNANGRLFDPVLTQIYGNIRCVSDSTISVLGNFELSSVSKRQYFVTRLSEDTIYHHEIDPWILIPENGISFDDIPFFWQYIHE